MNQIIIKILSITNDKLWIFISVLIMYTGIYFTYKLKGISFNIIKMTKELLKKEKNSTGINSFKTLMLSLAGRIGVGSISGIALAIYLGGPGTIFWIWFISILSAPLTYAETYLGIKYKVKDKNSNNIGGPSYYIKRNLNNHKLGSIYSIIILISYITGFISIQSNTITKSITTIYNINPLIIGLTLSIITLIIIFGGINKIANTTSKIVPIMSLLYIGISVYIIITNINLVPNIITSIISSAFNIKAFTSSFLPTMILGVQRGIFSSEAGIGTCAIAASTGNNNNPISGGYIQMLGIYITTFLICTNTAIIVLTSNYKILNIKDINGIEIALHAFKYHLNSTGTILLLILIILFAFSTILTGYYYGETSLEYFNKAKKTHIIILKFITIIIIFLGSFFSSTVMWKFTDFFIGILILINIYAIIKLKNEIKK